MNHGGRNRVFNGSSVKSRHRQRMCKLCKIKSKKLNDMYKFFKNNVMSKIHMSRRTECANALRVLSDKSRYMYNIGMSLLNLEGPGEVKIH